jgi:hypothetical protein
MIDHELVSVHHGHFAVDRNACLLARGVDKGAVHHHVRPVQGCAVRRREDLERYGRNHGDADLIGHRTSGSRGGNGIDSVGRREHHDGVVKRHIPDARIDADRIGVGGAPSQGGRLSRVEGGGIFVSRAQF